MSREYDCVKKTFLLPAFQTTCVIRCPSIHTIQCAFQTLKQERKINLFSFIHFVLLILIFEHKPFNLELGTIGWESGKIQILDSINKLLRDYKHSLLRLIWQSEFKSFYSCFFSFFRYTRCGRFNLPRQLQPEFPSHTLSLQGDVATPLIKMADLCSQPLNLGGHVYRGRDAM